MSIPVQIEDLARALEDFGAGYLLTSGGGRVKAVTVEPSVEAGVLRIGEVSRGSAANIADHPQVTLLWPPLQQRGYSLIVDGTAEVTDDAIVVTAAAAVLHRPAAHADGPPASPSGCGHDCAPVGSARPPSS